MIDLNINIETSIISTPEKATLFVTYRDKCVAKVVYEDDNLDIVVPLIRDNDIVQAQKEVLGKIEERINDIHEILKNQT